MKCSEANEPGRASYRYTQLFTFQLVRSIFYRSHAQGIGAKCQSVFEATGKRPLLFRPPYGVINPMLRRALRGSGFHVIGFSKRAWDTSSRKEKVILTRIMKNLHPGDIILLHDTIPQTIDIIKNLAELLKQAGFQIVSLEKLLNISAYEV